MNGRKAPTSPFCVIQLQPRNAAHEAELLEVGPRHLHGPMVPYVSRGAPNVTGLDVRVSEPEEPSRLGLFVPLLAALVAEVPDHATVGQRPRQAEDGTGIDNAWLHPVTAIPMP